MSFASFSRFEFVNLGIDEEPIGVVPDIGNVDFTDKKKKKQKRVKQKGLGGDKRRNKPRTHHH